MRLRPTLPAVVCPVSEREKAFKADTASLSDPSRLYLWWGGEMEISETWRGKIGIPNEIVVGNAPSTFNNETRYDTVVGSR